MAPVEKFLPAPLLAKVAELRVCDPEFAYRAAQSRLRRTRLTPDGKLNILAADHPARRVTKVGDDPIAMADRHSYLARILRALIGDTVDGLMATMDVLEDLLAIAALVHESGGPALLDGKLLIASLNRGGLAQSSWELDDPMTGPSPATCAEWHLDGTKILLRIADDERDSVKTTVATAQAITDANRLHLPTFLEPLPVVRSGSGFSVVKHPEALARIVGVASALGDSSRYLWLKLPYCEPYDKVVRATTLPVLLLGGESAGDAQPFLRQLAAALSAGPNVRGALAGRNVLYPGDEDPLVIAEACGAIVHKNLPIEQAWQQAAAQRGRDMELLAACM